MIETGKQFDEMVRRSEDAVRNAFPMESPSYLLKAANFRWSNLGQDMMSDISLHKEYKLKEKTLAAVLKADLVIIDKAGKTVDRESGFTLLLLPHVTTRASYIVDGNEVQTVNQLRLRPGPYTRFTISEDTETFINAAGGGYRVMFSRQTGILRIKSGTTYVYIYPILKALGITDRQMEQAWGADVLALNRAHDDPRQVTRLYRSMRRFAEILTDQAELATAVDSFFRSKQLDPEISRITMGEAHDSITPRVLLDASAKAVRLARGEIDIDDTESLAFKSIHAVEDFVPERLEKAVPGIKFVVSRKMERTPKISNIISPDTFTNPVKNWFLTSEFTRYSTQQNPIDMTSTSQLTTTMGEGGIQSDYAVTDQLRVVHPSQMAFLDPMHSPEGHRIGVTGHLTIGTEKIGNRLYIHVLNAKTGEIEQKSSQDLANTTIAANDQFDVSVKPPRPLAAMVKVKRGNEITIAPARTVDYIFLTPTSFFSAATNAIPFMHTNSPNRVLMADRHIEQAVPLVDATPPIVQSRFKGNEGYDDFFGRNFNVQSPVDGTVTRVGKDDIKIRDRRGVIHAVAIHNNYPLNGGSFLTDRPIVKADDKVHQGQVLTENNFTRDGSLALGRTLKVAFLPYKGQNFEDGTVISEGAAKKLTSVHKYDYRLEITKNVHVGLRRWLAHFPDKALNVATEKYDSDGVVKKGAVMKPTEVLIPAVEQSTPHEEYDYAVLHKSLKTPWRDVSIAWDGDTEAEVVDVVKTGHFIRVILKTKEQAQVGDKLSNRAGGKGIIVNILPDNEMYRDEQGNVVDVLFNPAGMIGRINPGQMFEGIAGKIANKTGKKYLVDNFSDESAREKIEADMKAAGVKDIENLTDPATNKVVKDIFVGDTYFIKLQHQVSKKFSARGIEKYTADAQPSKVSGESAQNIGSGELFSLLAAGALHFLKDSSSLKSNYNPEYWRALQAGLPTPPPRTPFILDKFTTYLEGAGINLQQEGSQLKALPMTDADTKARSMGEIMNPGVVRALDLRPETGGLFDKGVTGGFGGAQWNHINLEIPIPNPLMEKPIISVTGLKPAEYKAIVSGSLFVTKDGELTADASEGAPMGAGLKILLSKVNINKALQETIEVGRSATGNRLDELNKKRRYLTALKSMRMRPEDAYVTSVVPVVPARFRPVYPLPDGSLNIADPNHCYREIILINNQLKELKAQGVDNKNLAKLRTDLFGAVQGMVGVTEPLTRSKHFKGFISTIKGRSNKYGLFQGRVVRRPQDLSARSTVIPDPGLGIDEVGIPEDMAFTLYSPFLVRRLVNAGQTPANALDMVKAKDPLARDALMDEAKQRPLYMNRAPSLHRFSMMPFKPRIVSGKAINVNPLIVAGYNMDFNGDSCSPDSVIHIRRVFDGSLFIGTFDEFVKTDLFPGIDDAGLMKIAKGKTGVFEFDEGAYETLGIAEDRIEWQPLNQITIHTSHGPCFEISFESGDTLVCSEHHNLFGVDPKSLDLFTFKTEKYADYPDVIVPVVSSWKAPAFDDAQMPALDEARNLTSIPIDDDLAWWIGVYVGEGSLTGRDDTISCSSSDSAMLGQIKSIMGRLGPIWETEHQVRITGKDLYRAFKEEFGKGSENKRFPSFVFGLPAVQRAQVITGFFDAEAQATFDVNGRPFLTVELTSLQALRQATMLLKSIGIQATIRDGRKKENRKRTWILYVAKSGFQALPSFRSETKRAWQNQIRGAISRSTMDMVPLFDSIFAALTKKGIENRNENKKNRQARREWGRKFLVRYGVSFGPVSKDDFVKEKVLLTRRAALRIIAWYGPFDKGTLLDKWRTLVENITVSYTKISCRKIDRLPILYDFNVPPNEAFVVNSGIVTHNTVGIHVPVSEAARREAMEQLPSKNLFAARDDMLIHLPSKETVLGIYMMTAPKGVPARAASLEEMMKKFEKKEIEVNTPMSVAGKTWTPGQMLVNDVFPQDLRPGNVTIDKNILYKALYTVARRYPKMAGQVIDKIKDYGNHYVTDLGFSIGLKDLEFDTKARDKIMTEARDRSKKVGFETAHNEALAKLTDMVKSRKDNRLIEGSVTSGAFGKADAVTQMLATPVAVMDHRDRVIPVAIKHGFAEGHDLMSYWSTIPGSRKGLMQKGLGTQDTGAFSKRLVNTAITEIISIDDCKTTNGILMAVDSRDALDRVVADGPYKGKIIDTNLAKTMKGHRISMVKVRSPMHCQAPTGICAKCFGLTQQGQFPPVGYHVGALAGQTISEPMTQLQLRAFHTGGAMGKKTVGFDRVEQIFEMPENLPGKATLAQVSGTVEKIEKGAGGGWIVFIGGMDHFVPLERGLGVKKGQRILAGQKLSASGVIKPQELLAATNDIDRVRRQMLDDLDDEFAGNGVRVKRKIFETALKPMTDRAEVTDAGDGEKFQVYKGDIVSVNRLNDINRQLKKAKATPVEFKSTLLALNVAPYHSGDFIGQLMFDRPHQTLITAPGVQAVADLKKGHPVTQYVFGAKER